METTQTMQTTPSVDSTKKGISGSTIKLIAIIAMFIDHIGATILERMLLNRGYEIAVMNPDLLSNWMRQNGNATLLTSYFIMRLIGRFGFPIFCFLLVEGFVHTHSRKKYALRLFLFALISEVPFDLAIAGKAIYIGYQNVFFTLLIGLLAMCAYDFLRSHLQTGIPSILLRIGGMILPALYLSVVLTNLTYDSIFIEFQNVLSVYAVVGIFFIIIAVAIALILYWQFKKHGHARMQTLSADLTVLFAAMLLADLLQTDYSGMGVLTISLMYAFRHNKVTEMLAGCITLTVMSLMEATAFLMLIPIAKYNGKRGLNIKYFFYAFYPVHLALLYLVCKLMGLA